MIRRVMVLLAFFAGTGALAHPLGNFSINRWAGLESTPSGVRVHYVVDYAEIPTMQAQERADALELGKGLHLDDVRPELVASNLSFAPGASGLKTMRLEATYDAAIADGHPVTFKDDNFAGRAGWREVIAWSGASSAVVGSSVPARDLSARLTSYPRDLTQAPPQVGEATFTLLRGAGAAEARRSGRAMVAGDAKVAASTSTGDGFMALIGSERKAGWGLMLAALGAALFWGGAHALSPGHGKTVVAAYLVGQRGAARHAVWLGLIVTATHTIGVFALGGLTLVLSRYFVPEAIYPWLGFVSGLIVVAMGLTLLIRRLLGREGHHHHPHGHDHGHSHAIPDRLTFRGLLALGISGGIVPCPSALVVLLSAIAFHQVLFGLALISAFSLGLAAVLVAVGLLMVYARSVFDRFDPGRGLTRRLGLISAAIVTILGAGIAWKSMPSSLASAISSPGAPLTGTALSVLVLGLLFGLKHATEADHIAAVSAIVSERRGLRSAVGTGALWGAGHTLSILVAGLLVLGLNVVIPERLARVLELGVALMIIVLGSAALARALRSRPDLHVHIHRHDGHEHKHLHFHEAEHAHVHVHGHAADHDHALRRAGLKPLLVGMMHGLAGSAALTLLVLAQIRSVPLGLTYLLVFGLGSIGGMALMSLLISLPFAATASRPGWNRGIRVATGIMSLSFGLFYAWTQLG